MVCPPWTNHNTEKSIWSAHTGSAYQFGSKSATKIYFHFYTVYVQLSGLSVCHKSKKGDTIVTDWLSRCIPLFTFSSFFPHSTHIPPSLPQKDSSRPLLLLPSTENIHQHTLTHSVTCSLHQEGSTNHSLNKPHIQRAAMSQQPLKKYVVTKAKHTRVHRFTNWSGWQHTNWHEQSMQTSLTPKLLPRI